MLKLLLDEHISPRVAEGLHRCHRLLVVRFILEWENGEFLGRDDRACLEHAAAKGEEIIIRDRNLPIAKLVPFSPEEATTEELRLVVAGKMRLPETAVNVEELLKIPTGSVAGRAGIQAILDERAENR